MASALLLGSGGWIPTSRRETCSAYLRDGDHVLVIDAGTGIHRLIENPQLLEGAKHLDLVLTHFHLDHTAGLSYLPALPLEAVVWGPGQLNYGTATEEILGRLLGSPLFASTPADLTAGVREIPAEPFEVGPFELRSRTQRLHPDPTLALRIGDTLAYCTDTAADSGNVEFAAGSRVLCHEAWYAQDTTDDETHSAAGEAGRIAAAAGVEQLVLIHVSPLLASDDELAAPARDVFENAAVGEDLVPLVS